MFDSKITTLIIEKNEDELSDLVRQIKSYSEFSIVGTATSGNKGISLIHDYAPQLIFVNTELQDIDGLEFVKVLHNRNILAEIVFVSESEERAFEALPLEPLDFLIKPIPDKIIRNMIERLLAKLRKKELMRKMDIFARETKVAEKRIFKQQKGIIVIQLDEIVFCKAELTTTKLYLRNGEIVSVKSGISQTLEILNNDDFIRINRSNVINRNFLRKIDKRNLKCLMYYEGESWKVSASKNTIGHLEKLIVYPVS